MRRSNESILSSTMVLAILGTAGCSHRPGVQEFPDTANPKVEYSKLKTELDQALEGQTDVLAPSSFRAATKSLREAEKDLNNQADASDTLSYIAEGRAYLGEAKRFAKLSQENIGDVVVARKQAIDAGAMTLLAKDFKATDKKLSKVTADIENNDLDDATEQRSALQLAYLSLELEAIKQKNLNPATEAIRQAEDQGAAEFAPRSLAIAKKHYTDAESFITANRRNTTEIGAQSKQAIATAEHLLKITRDSKSGENTSAEDAALSLEAEQLRTAKSKQQTARGAVANQTLIDKNAELASDQAFQARFEAARKAFSPNEADVYKQGDSLVIRLRGLDFPVAKAELKGSSFALLAKVQKVIDDFGKGSVIVEGHTDSNGGKALNEKLSAARAEAVKKYLLSLRGEQPMSIEAVGYGFQKPLASNKTPTGRSQNRRVDVVIQAEKM